MKRIRLTLFAIILLTTPMVAQFVDIPDYMFFNAILGNSADTNADGAISFEEAKAMLALDVSNSEIEDMTGIEAFVNLDTLNCAFNSISELEISALTGLVLLSVESNELTSLDVSNNDTLEVLECDDNLLTSLDVTNNIALRELSVSSNSISSLDISNNSGLKDLYCNGNLLTSLDVSNNTALVWLSCRNNQITDLDLTSNPDLQALYIQDNSFTSIDLSQNSALKYLRCRGNLFTRLDLSTNSSLQALSIDDMPSLTCVTVWEIPFPPAGFDLDTTGSPNVVFTTDYCPDVGFEENHQSSLTIYPNPTENLITIETGIMTNHFIELTSLNGQIVYSTQMNTSTHLIDLSSFRKGVYFITVRSKDIVATRKIVKR